MFVTSMELAANKNTARPITKIETATMQMSKIYCKDARTKR